MARAARTSRRDNLRSARQQRLVGTATQLVNHLKPPEILDPEGIEKVHQAALKLLSDFGMLILDYPPP
ncbi:MAG: trimethylamine methyltransferase family protein [Deinococcales bacterium]